MYACNICMLLKKCEDELIPYIIILHVYYSSIHVYIIILHVYIIILNIFIIFLHVYIIDLYIQIFKFTCVPVGSPHKGQWRGTMMFFLSTLEQIAQQTNRRDADDSRRHCAHYDVTVIISSLSTYPCCVRWCPILHIGRSICKRMAINVCLNRRPEDFINIFMCS